MKLSDSAARIKGKGFIAALDQSGGSTPKALMAYGIAEGSWKDEAEMFDLIHQMRARIIKDKAFDKRISGAILFERTMLGEIDGMPTADYLLEKKDIVPFLKVDEGLLEAADGVRLMKPMKKLDALLKSANQHHIYGTKMRSVILEANEKGIAEIVKQQFDVGRTIIAAGLMPILEPEVDIKSPTKKESEMILREQILKHLDGMDSQIMLKLTLPDEPDFYKPLIDHPKVLRVVALSGGYSRDDANKKLSQNHGMTASFSRALIEDLRSQQSDAEFSKALDEAIQSIFDASNT